jgi:hypothetical protein
MTTTLQYMLLISSRPASGAGAKGLFGAGVDMGIARAGANGVLMLAGWGGLGILLMRVGCGWEWVVTRRVDSHGRLNQLLLGQLCLPLRMCPRLVGGSLLRHRQAQLFPGLLLEPRCRRRMLGPAAPTRRHELQLQVVGARKKLVRTTSEVTAAPG